MSARDFRGRLLAPVMALPRRPLSSRESTDSCSMRFSLRTMMSGAFSSSRRFRRLLRLLEGLEDLQALGELLDLGIGVGGLQIAAHALHLLIGIEGTQQFPHPLG